MNVSPVCRVREVAAALDVSEWWVYDRIRRQEIPVVPMGKAKRVPRKWLEEYLEAQKRAVAS